MGVIYQEVTLDEWECRQARLVGQWRTAVSRKQNLSKTAGGGGASQHPSVISRNDEIGAGGEMAFAKWANVYWSYSVNSFAAQGDVGNIEVRTGDNHSKNLLIRPYDFERGHSKENSPFVCVTGSFPDFRIWGWAMAKEVAVDRYWRDNLGNARRGCWIMPRAHLHPLTSLPIARSI